MGMSIQWVSEWIPVGVSKMTTLWCVRICSAVSEWSESPVSSTVGLIFLCTAATMGTLVLLQAI